VAELEKHAQRAYFEWLKTVPAPGFPGRTLWEFVYAVPNGTMIAGNSVQRARYMAFLKAQGLKPGVSDICIALPVGKWHGAYLEMKRDDKAKLSEDQAKWLALMGAAGYYSAKTPGFESAVEHTKTYLKG
jgi:hypothetical protein